ncbi:hypothetical protein H8O98_004646, partial [Escherichia coli]|nr:hypothetical protein [Escherichia coli]
QMLYSMKVHPPLWRAGLRQNFRIFQKLSGLERAETGAEGFRYDRHGNLLAYTDGTGR